MEFLLLLMAAHLLSDLVFRPKYGLRDRGLHRYLLAHSAIHMGIGLLLTIFMLSFASLLTIGAVTVSHYFIDLFKTKTLRPAIANKTLVDIIDQVMHFSAIIVLVIITGP